MNSFASSEATCYLVDGIYKNSTMNLSDLKFSTVVDVFTLTNAHSLSMNLDGEELKLIRTNLLVKRFPRMTYRMKKKNKVLKTVFIMLDRSPKKISQTKEFYGNMIIPKSPETSDEREVITEKSLVYNFYCRF